MHSIRSVASCDDGVEHVAAEPDRVREQHLGVDAALVHDLQAGLRVPRPGVDPVDALFHRLQERDLAAVVVDDAAALGETELGAVDDPRGDAVALLDVQDPVLVRRRRPPRPQVGRLGEMRVRVDHLDVVIQLRHGVAPFDRCCS